MIIPFNLKLEQELYIEVWGRNDNPDLEVGYELIANLEDRFEAIINDLRKRCGELDENCMYITEHWLSDYRFSMHK